MPAAATRLVTLDPSLFEKSKHLEKARDNFSAIVLEGNRLWLGGDEGTRIDRLTLGADGNFNKHQRFDVTEILDLPDGGGDKQEIDIEGLDFDDGYLWLIGSHSRKRTKPEEGRPEDENLARLADVRIDGNRFTLGRFPLGEDDAPADEADTRHAARLEGDAGGGLLLAAIRADPMLGPFCAIPSKDNGLDIEGLAVRGNRVFAGLRGPVLRGWAVILDFEVGETAGNQNRLTLTRPIRKHLLRLDGLGVREIALHHKDLFVLAGPTMDLDGPVGLYRWANATDRAADSLTGFGEGIEKVLDVPFEQGKDHAEGIALIRDGLQLQAMICYDSPHASRTPSANQILLDVFDL